MQVNFDDIFVAQRNCYSFDPKRGVDEKLLEEIHEISKYGSTSFNSCPLRIIFVRSPEKRELLISTLMPGNEAKVKSAPVTAIFAYDTKFYDKFGQLMPQMSKDITPLFANNQTLAHDTAFRNSSLQAAYFMITARAKGLACGAISGFDENKLNKLFFENTTLRANFLCNLGYPDGPPPYPRAPRLSFKEACKFE